MLGVVQRSQQVPQLPALDDHTPIVLQPDPGRTRPRSLSRASRTRGRATDAIAPGLVRKFSHGERRTPRSAPRSVRQARSVAQVGLIFRRGQRAEGAQIDQTLCPILVPETLVHT
jgi:hypothetical protein